MSQLKEEIISESRHQTLMHYLDKIEELISPEPATREREASSVEGEEGKAMLMTLNIIIRICFSAEINC